MHVIIGSGGLAKQVYPHLNKKSHLVFFDDTKNSSEYFYMFGHPIWNDLEYLKQRTGVSPFKFTICIGDPKWRRHFSELMLSLGGSSDNIISKNSSIYSEDLGQANILLDFTLIENGAKLGFCNMINCYAGIFHDVEIGNYNEIMPGAKLLGGVKIGNSCRIGSNSTILPNVKICSDVIIGAGAVVTADITKPGTYIGIPARKYVKIGSGLGIPNSDFSE